MMICAAAGGGGCGGDNADDVEWRVVSSMDAALTTAVDCPTPGTNAPLSTERIY